jgi:hypothetical protein
MQETTEITTFKPRQAVLSEEERAQLACLVRSVAIKNELGAALSALWEQQKAIGFILGEPSVGENLSDESKFLAKKIGPYWLIHSPARKDRKNVPFLTARGILREHPILVYEKLEAGAYDHYPAKKHGFTDICFLCSAQGANPNEVLVPIELGGAEFVYGANYATLGHSHFTVWTRVPILQKYWPEDTLLWLAEHGKRLASGEYTTFFNGLGAGNSIKHFHYQTLQESFPILQAAVDRKFTPSGIVRLVWPIPAYRITIAPQINPRDALLPMDSFAREWLAMDQNHSFNLVQKSESDGTGHFVFVPRVDSTSTRRPPQISNDFAGCEVGGRINIEKRDEWEWARTQSESVVAGLLESLAPRQDRIAALETRL